MIDELLHTGALWQMSLAERASIIYLLHRMKRRQVAIEVGTYRGGFLRVLSRHFRHVYSLDVDHSAVQDRDAFNNVTWVEGDSRETLPALVAALNKDRRDVNLVLIDGDHACDAALRDITSVLGYRPRSELALLLHDSWYGPTRQAINQAPWGDCPYVHLVEKDFVPGDLIGSDAGNLFVGGLALAVLRPERREGPLEIGQSQDYMYRICRGAVETS